MLLQMSSNCSCRCLLSKKPLQHLMQGFSCRCTIHYGHAGKISQKFLLSLASTAPARNVKDSSGTENSTFCPRLFLFLHEISKRRELRDIVPGPLEATTCSKAKLCFVRHYIKSLALKKIYGMLVIMCKFLA